MNVKMSYFSLFISFTHPELAMLAPPLSTRREGRTPMPRGWGESTIKYDNKYF